MFRHGDKVPVREGGVSPSLASLPQVVDYRDGELGGHEEPLGIFAHLAAAHGAGVAGVVGDAIAQAHHALYAPTLAGQHPAIAVDDAHGAQVALEALRLQVGEDAERHVHPAGVVVGVEQVGSDEVAGVGGAEPVAGFGLYGDVLQLLVVRKSERVPSRR